jgi:hypothetical protein
LSWPKSASGPNRAKAEAIPSDFVAAAAMGFAKGSTHPTGSQRHDDLAEMLVGFHVREGGADLVELVDLVDRQLQFSRFNRAPRGFGEGRQLNAFACRYIRES